MDAEILILGLALFCIQGDGECDLPGLSDSEGRVYFVNATASSNPECKEIGNNCTCKTCGSHGPTPCHKPLLIVYKSHYEPANYDQCPGSCFEPQDFGCIDISNKSLCIVETDGVDDFAIVPGRDLTKPEPEKNYEDPFGWIASIRIFDSLGGCEGEKCFRTEQELSPGGQYVIASLDFSDEGRLKAARVGKDKFGNYTHWKPKGSTIPYETALAESAIWDLPALTSFKITICDGADLLVAKGSTPEPRAIIANLPPDSYCGGAPGKGVPKLNHYALYYRLFDQPSSCTVPVVAKYESYLSPLDIKKYLKDGAFELSSRVDGFPGGEATTALCPPTKFP